MTTLFKTSATPSGTPKTLPAPSSDHRWAILAYASVIVVFVSVCVIAVLTTMNNEANKTGFQSIEVSQPISFFDKTYLKENTSQEASPATAHSSSPSTVQGKFQRQGETTP